jgi:hypothetical protein
LDLLPGKILVNFALEAKVHLSIYFYDSKIDIAFKILDIAGKQDVVCSHLFVKTTSIEQSLRVEVLIKQL